MKNQNAKHTEGPWENGDQNKAGITPGCEGLRTVWATSCDGLLKNAVAENCSYADARLIAAAPDLLAACVEASELIRLARQYFPKSIRNSDRFNLENTCAMIGSAIAKARGNSMTCPNDGEPLVYYSGCLGYESYQCPLCHYDINDSKCEDNSNG